MIYDDYKHTGFTFQKKKYAYCLTSTERDTYYYAQSDDFALLIDWVNINKRDLDIKGTLNHFQDLGIEVKASYTILGE